MGLVVCLVENPNEFVKKKGMLRPKPGFSKGHGEGLLQTLVE